jgi:hypothetical protein
MVSRCSKAKQKAWLQHQLKKIIAIGVMEKEGNRKAHLGHKRSLLHEGGLCTKAQTV